MAIFYDYTIRVNGDKAKLNKDIYLYRNDKNIDYYIDVKDANFKYSKLENGSIIESLNADHATIKILKPNKDKLTLEGIPIVDGKMRLGITADMIDEIGEVGDYTFQVHLFDGDVARATIPPVESQFHILEPIYGDDEGVFYEVATVGESRVGRNIIGKDVGYELGVNSDFDLIWAYGDIITEKKMNNMVNEIKTHNHVRATTKDIDNIFNELYKESGK